MSATCWSVGGLLLTVVAALLAAPLLSSVEEVVENNERPLMFESCRTQAFAEKPKNKHI